MTQVRLTVSAEEEKPPSLASVARNIQWAQKTVDAALPLVPSEEDQPVYDNWHRDRVHMRGIAFGHLLSALDAGSSGSLEELDALWQGTVPGPRE